MHAIYRDSVNKSYTHLSKMRVETEVKLEDGAASPASDPRLAA